MMFSSLVIVLIAFLIVADAFKRIPQQPPVDSTTEVENSSNLRGSADLAAANPHMMTYRGGRIIPTSHVVPIYAALNFPMAANLTSYYRNLRTGNFIEFHKKEYNLKKQKFTSGSVLQPVTFDWSSPTRPLVTDTLQQNFLAAIASGALPRPTKNTVYAIHFQGGYISEAGGSCLDAVSEYCGFHQGITIGNIYAPVMFIPDMTVPSCTGCAYNIDNVPITPINAFYSTISHELSEVMTDPDVNYASLTWYNDVDGEDADYCGNRMGTIVMADKRSHPVQMIWSNKSKKCVVPRK